MNRRDEIRDMAIQLLLSGDFNAGEAVEQAVEIQNEMDTWDFDDDDCDSEPTIIGLSDIVGVDLDSGRKFSAPFGVASFAVDRSPVETMAKKLEQAFKDWQDEITAKAVDHSIARRCQDIAVKACGFDGVADGVTPEQSVQELADQLVSLEAQIQALQQCNADCRDMAANALGVHSALVGSTREAVKALADTLKSTREDLRVVADRYFGR